MQPQTLTLQGRLHEIERASRFAGGFCRAHGLGRAQCDVLILILEELITNTVKHGLPPEQAPISIALERAPDGIRVRYRDHGKPFDPNRDLPEPNLEDTLTERRTGGLGWPLIKHYCSRLDYRREPDANLLELTIALDVDPAPAGR